MTHEVLQLPRPEFYQPNSTDYDLMGKFLLFFKVARPQCDILGGRDCGSDHMVLWILGVVLMFVISLVSTRAFRRESKQLRSPPGSDGWFFVGETLQLITSSPIKFVQERVQKFGDVFYTNILRRRLLVVHQNELMKIVLDDPHQSFLSRLPQNVAQLYGPGSIVNSDGPTHRKLSLDLVEASAPKHHKAWLALFSQVIQKTMESWKNKTINCQKEGQKMFIEMGLVYIFGYLNKDEEMIRKLVRCTELFDKGLVSFPVNLPGTQFYAGMQARKQMDKVVLELRQRYLERIQGGDPPVYCMLEFFMENYKDSEGNSGQLSREELPTRMVNVIHGQFDFLAVLYDWLMMFLTENPLVLDKLKEEQMAVRNLKEGKSYVLVPEDLSRMTYSWQIIQETLRLATVVNGTIRKCTRDIEYEGYTIPANWDYLGIIRSLHYNPENFPDPERFDPSRFEGEGKKLKPNSYMPFGRGRRYCKGAKLTKLQLLAVLHYLTTTLSWKSLTEKPIKVGYAPAAHLVGGYTIQVLAD